MLIDKTDLAILRHLERSGRWLSPLVTQLKMSEDDISIRIKKMENEGVIAGYKATIFIPPFLGGDWIWGCVMATTAERDKTVARVLQKLPFVSEIWFNSNLPSHLGHNFSIIFYSKDFDMEVKFIREISEISYLEAYRISNFNFPMARIYSTEEKSLLKTIFDFPTADNDKLAEICQKSPSWIQTKIEKLVWTPQNKDGVIMVLPDIQFKRIQNYSHCHFILEITDNRDVLFDEFKTLGFDIVLDGRPFQGRYFQLEADMWGFNDVIAKKTFLESHKEVKIQGIIFAEEMRVNADWGLKLINS